MRIPVSTDWFGYHFYNSDVTPNDPSDFLSETVGIILSYRYHGSANHFYAEITLDSNDNSAFWTIVDGLLQHEETEAGSNNYLVGGSFGWGNPPSGATGF
jgi:hypothetical protein